MRTGARRRSSRGATAGSRARPAPAPGSGSSKATASSAVVVMRPSRVPTGATSPSPTRISRSTPSTADGTSASTLSVDTSNSVSSTATPSPGCLYHRTIVPSVTVSPSWGIVTRVVVTCSASGVRYVSCSTSATSGGSWCLERSGARQGGAATRFGGRGATDCGAFRSPCSPLVELSGSSRTVALSMGRSWRLDPTLPT